MTRRSWGLRSHTGEVCFPGGRHEPGDADLAATALRETEEEIAIPSTSVRLVGFLEPLATVSSPAAILPLVGLLDGRPDVVPDPGEVDGVLHVTVAELLDPRIFREEIWRRDGVELAVSFFELDGDTLWGATARMIRGWLERLVEADG